MRKVHKNSYRGLKLTLLAIATGILLLGVVYMVCTEKETEVGERSAENALEFLKQQCIRYDNLSATEYTKEQVELLDKAIEMKFIIEESSETADPDFIRKFLKRQRISGIILADSNCQIVSEVFVENDLEDEIYEVMEDEAVTDILQYPQKCYLSNLYCDDGTEYKYAVIAANGGLIACYNKESNNDLTEDTSLFENLVSGYRMEMDGMIMITDGEKILSSNNEELIGVDIDDYPLISKNLGMISSDKVSQISQDGVKYMAMGGKTRDYYLYVFFPAKSVYTLSKVAMAYVLIIYIFAILVLIMFKQREISNTNKVKMEFLHQMSHDIRTPINGIRGMVRIGNHYPDDVQKQKECRDKIWEASGLLLDLVNDVLDMGKLESGEMKMEETSFNLREVMENIADVMESQAKVQNVNFAMAEIDAEHFNLIGSAVYLRRILVNITSNAIKYNKKNGTVKLYCREAYKDFDTDRRDFEFICEDTGIGMSRDFQKNMFKRFTQEKAMEEVAHHGTGLGLSIVKNLLDEMGGTIRCESNIGKGTTFYVTIPFEIDTLTPNVVYEEKFENKSLEGMTVLLVEDNEINMEVSEFILKQEGMNVIKAWNGKEAVDIFKNSHMGEIDIVLMDIMMPVMDGETATRHIRELGRKDGKLVPIIAMTANAFEEDIQTAIDAGMNEHIAKPIDPEGIKRAMLKYL